MIRKNTDKFVVLSVCDGISCAYQSLKEVGYREENVIYIASEIDRDAIKISKANHSNVYYLDDIRNISYVNGQLYNTVFEWKSVDEKIKHIKKNKSENEFKKNQSKILKDALELWKISPKNKVYNGKIDLICAGTPCTDVSVAGKGAGIYGNTSSSLFWQFKRLIDEVNPTYWFLENVKMHNRWESAITNELNKAPLRINSRDLSAQNRERLYWTNITDKVPEIKEKSPSLESILEFENQKWIDTTEKYYKNEPKYNINACAQRARYLSKTSNKTTQVIEFRHDYKSNCLTTVAKNAYV